MTTRQEVTEKLIAEHNPDLIKQPGSVYILFADGELCFTKAGELWGQRNVHQFEMPVGKLEQRPLDLPFTAFGHRCVILEPNEENRNLARIVQNLSD